jgi:xanthine dehydrogenase large subunit
MFRKRGCLMSFHGKNIVHDSSYTHVSGKSTFIDDRERYSSEVFVGIITSKCAKGVVKAIDFSKALEIDGVYAGYSSEDFVNNSWGTIIHDQPLLATQIEHYDEPIGILACESRELFEEVKSLVVVDIEEQKAVLDFDDAINSNEYIYTAVPFIKGDTNEVFKNATYILEGDFYSGGQEHFYLESQACIAYPLENGGVEIHASSQHSTEVQHVVAHALGIPMNKVACIVKRMGGGFGGKESQPALFATLASLVATKLQRSARIVLTKDEDMKMTGKRHPTKTFYKVAFDKNGKIEALEADIYSNAGAYTDVTPSILDRSMYHIDGAYELKNAYIKGYACKTNYPSNTAFRGFGGPQGTFVIESIMEDIANHLGIDSLDVRKINHYKGEEGTTPFGQVVTNNKLPELFSKIESSSEYKKRRKEIDAFNEENNGYVKGLALSAVKFGIAFTARHLNQGNALVNIHLDGTIEASTGATEMGQGVNTKIQQIIAETFSIEASQVRIMATSTQRNANTSPTAASSGSDLNCGAALKACTMIKQRLQKVAWQHFYKKIDESQDFVLDIEGEFEDIEFIDGRVIYKKDDKSIGFVELLDIAYKNRISISEYAHFKTKNLNFEKSKGYGKAFNYFTNGVAVSEVMIDEFTGQNKIVQTDILMDLGRMINPGIDEGQVAGAFIQGYGWVCMENLVYNKGELLSHSPTTYKIPSICDMPEVFNIDFIENNTNTVNVRASKAVGEPPFLLGISVFMAIKDALKYRANKQQVKIDAPATNENILMTLERLKEDV